MLKIGLSLMIPISICGDSGLLQEPSFFEFVHAVLRFNAMFDDQHSVRVRLRSDFFMLSLTGVRGRIAEDPKPKISPQRSFRPGDTLRNTERGNLLSIAGTERTSCLCGLSCHAELLSCSGRHEFLSE